MMACKPPMVASVATGTPKLGEKGSSVLTGRQPTFLSSRPSLVVRLEAHAYGLLYLLIEHALGRLCDKRDQLPKASMKAVNAEVMKPT